MAPRLEPGRDAGKGILDFRRGDGEREAHVAVAVHGVEIDAGRGGNAGILQQLHAECQAVIGEA